MSQDATLPRHGAADFSRLGTQKTPIEKTELRGITLPQLEQLDDFIERHADEHGVLHGWLDRKGQPLHKDRINLYDVVKYVVKPATKEHKCSYVELVAPAGTSSQRPKWFVSHWWGEPVKDFIKALKNHAKVRGLASTDAYWVCAYANNQHDLDADIPDDPKQSAFFKAMQLCKVSGTTEHSLRYGVASQCPAAQCVQ